MPAAPSKEAPDLRELYPDLTEEQLKEVEETFINYIRIAWWIFEQQEPEKVGSFDEGFERL